MKLFKMTLVLIISIYLSTSIFLLANEKPRYEFFIYNTIIEYEANSEFAIVYNRDNKNIKYQKNADQKAYPASLTKMLTVLVSLENIKDVSEIVSIDRDSYIDMINQNSSMAGFTINERVTYWDLLHGTMLSSGGEAANTLAINVAGSSEKFVAMMNKKAKELNMLDSNFTNIEGLHDEMQYTTALDMVKLMDYALENPDFKTIITALNYQTTKTAAHPNGITLKSTVLSMIEDDESQNYVLVGGKSGYTPQAGRNWATLSIRNDIEYITIVMGAKSQDQNSSHQLHIIDTVELLQLLNESND